jgi:hypothetical protein
LLLLTLLRQTADEKKEMTISPTYNEQHCLNKFQFNDEFLVFFAQTKVSWEVVLKIW